MMQGLKVVLALATAVVMAGCDVTTVGMPMPDADKTKQPQTMTLAQPNPVSTNQAARNFVEVISRVEHVAEATCRAKSPGAFCDFQIGVDDREGLPPNAYQTIDNFGRPVIAFTLSLLVMTRNQDELAFILGHEAGHHIAGHIERTQQSAMAGALIGGALASLSGAAAAEIDQAQQMGAQVGARRYSKDFELEADALGTLIAFRAGYDPLIGAQFFARIPDPGNRFLGTHPPNAARVQTVRTTLAGLQ
jgi:Zn-dependent protease with chaperone function